MRDSASIFLRTDDGLVELRESEYETEDVLQELLALYPNLLPGDQIDPIEPRRLLLVRREMEVPGEENGSGRWSLDHLFLDQEGVPTLVEVKRSSDTRIRREVVGQMLDYAANAVAYWPVEAVQAAFTTTCIAEGTDEEGVLRGFLGNRDTEDFWTMVRTNLQAGRIRLVFVADVIPQELRRVVEFLNGQMNPAEVLAIEVKQYVGQGLQTLVPRVLGQTAAAQQKKRTPRQGRKWDEASFLEQLANQRGPTAMETAQVLLEWARKRSLRLGWGSGAKNGSCYPMQDLDKTNYYTFAVWTYGMVLLPFYGARSNPELLHDEYMRRFASHLGEIVGASFSDEDLVGGPEFPLAALTDPLARTRFLEAMDDHLAYINTGHSGGAK